MRDGGKGEVSREHVRRDALSSLCFMLRIWMMTYVISKVVYYFVHTAYIEATLRDALYFELGLISFTAVVLVRTLL